MATLYDYTTLMVERAAPGVVVASLNRPDRMNAFTVEMFDEFLVLQQEVDADPDARVLILTGEGRGFCAGLDLSVAGTLPEMPAAEMLEKLERWAAAVTGFSTMRKPVIAAVNGSAAGGGLSLALAADIRIASTRAAFDAAFVRIGLSGGDVGSSWALPRVVGMGRAMEILLTGRRVEVDEALQIGLVTDVVEPEALRARAMEIALQICGNAPVGVALTKHALHQNVDASLVAALAVENRNQVIAAHTLDMAEGMAAFREKRAPRFIGR